MFHSLRWTWLQETNSPNRRESLLLWLLRHLLCLGLRLIKGRWELWVGWIGLALAWWDLCATTIKHLTPIVRRQLRVRNTGWTLWTFMAFLNKIYYILRRTSGPKRDKVRGVWRRVYNDEVYDLYSWTNIIQVIKSKRMRWVGHVAYMGERTGAYRVLVGRTERGRPLGKPRRIRRGNNKMDFQEGWMAWAGFIWLRIGTGGGLLWVQLWTFRFHKMKGKSWPAENLLASQEGLCSMEVNITAVCIKILTTTKNYLYHHHHHH